MILEQYISTNLATFIASVLGVIGFIRKVTKDVDDDLSLKRVSEISSYLKSATTKKAGVWLPDYIYIFDRVFSNVHLSKKCFFISSLISLFSYLSISFLLDLHIQDGWFALIGLAILFNIPSDYISLLLTRKLLEQPYSIYLLLLIDLVITFIITIFLITIVFTTLDGDFMNLHVFFSNFNELFTNTYISLLNGKIDQFEVFVITAFTTSIWLWLHALATLILRCICTIQYVVKQLNIEKKPIRAIGVTINLIIIVLSSLVVPFVA